MKNKIKETKDNKRQNQRQKSKEDKTENPMTIHYKHKND